MPFASQIAGAERGIADTKNLPVEHLSPGLRISIDFQEAGPSCRLKLFTLAGDLNPNCSDPIGKRLEFADFEGDRPDREAVENELAPLMGNLLEKSEVPFPGEFFQNLKDRSVIDSLSELSCCSNAAEIRFQSYVQTARLGSAALFFRHAHPN